MKKFYCLFLSILISLSFTFNADAATSNLILSSNLSNTSIDDLGNGYYGISFIEYPEASTCALGNKTGSKTYSIKNSSGTTVATFKLTASFTYSSSGAVTCTSASYSTSIKDNKWNFSNTSASKSGAKATGSFTATCKQLGITTDKITRTITLTCDKSGNLS